MQESDFQIDTCAAWVMACLTSSDPDEALVALSGDPQPLAGVVGEEKRPHPLVGLVTAMMAGALIRSGRPAEVEAIYERIADLFAPQRRVYVRGSNFSDLVGAFPYLHLSAIRAFLTLGDQASAFSVVLWIDKVLRRSPRWDIPEDPVLKPLLSHPAMEAYGPFSIERNWLLDRQDEILANFKPDRYLGSTYDFDECLVLNALLTEQPGRALPVLERRGLLGPQESIELANSGHLEFNAVCVLATLGRFDEALALARAMVQQGYYTTWRFDLESARQMAWTQDTRQNEWLAPLAETPAYQTFLDVYVRRQPFPVDNAEVNPLCALREETLESRKRKRCWLSQRLIQPGDPVVCARRLFGHASDGDFDIAAKEAFDASVWPRSRAQFLADAIPLSLLFPAPSLDHRSTWAAPAIARFCWEVGHNPATFDLDRAVFIIADHHPNPIRREWIEGKFVYKQAFEPMVYDQGHGDAVNFAWRLLKAGYAEELFARVSGLPQTKADKVFAMLAMFDRQDCRQAAARHFELPDLPATIGLVFSERPSIETHLALADYGDRHARWRKGLVSAMRAYAIHLYSNVHPGADWFLEGLEHFSRARCSQLLFFLIHHPEDDDVLATMIEQEWLPSGVGTGGYDAYENARAFYYRAAILNRMLHAPDRLDFWLSMPWVLYYSKMAKDRETRQLVERWRKRKAR
ncbi:hypothetical protein [Rhizobium sp. SYY.PMSO]|uniref:hypothetical protein n=1 Tax=Rhizobium sp. SYY.PMSO TaxID=3382192 RepID=UPI00398FDAF9